MRWFGPNDKVKLRDIRQSGATGAVNALHQVPVGAIWTLEDIRERKRLIRKNGLRWKVVESLPVHEDIKRRNGNYKEYIENYKISLKNLAKARIEVVTYNFMPLLDWVRTNFLYPNLDGTWALLFDHRAFIYFDVFLLKRPGSKEEYTQKQLDEALVFGHALSQAEEKLLFNNVMTGLPGATVNFTPEEILTILAQYAGIDDNILRENLILFLEEVAPVAEELGIKLAIHPDDPPFSVLGLPRVVRNQADIKKIFDAVPNIANGLCYCTGSLGAYPENDLLQIIDDWGDRIHFLHLRNVKRDNEHVFRESEHLKGDNPMVEIMEKLVLLMRKRNISLPMRPDHGVLFSLEKKSGQYPGYSFMGRLRGLSELRGLELGIMYKLDNK